MTRHGAAAGWAGALLAAGAGRARRARSRADASAVVRWTLTGWAMMRAGRAAPTSRPPTTRASSSCGCAAATAGPTRWRSTPRSTSQNGGPTTEHTKAGIYSYRSVFQSVSPSVTVRGGLRRSDASAPGRRARRHCRSSPGASSTASSRPTCSTPNATAIRSCSTRTSARSACRRVQAFVLPAAARLDSGGGAADRGVDPAVLPVPVSAAGRALVPAGRHAALDASRCRR